MMLATPRSAQLLSPSSAEGESCFSAEHWGHYVAECVYARHGNDVRGMLATWQWQLLILAEDEPNFPLPRFAVWEGDTKVIRVFRAPLERKFPHQPHMLLWACAHEMFHALVAHAYLNLLPHSCTSPKLSRTDEEIAAHAFARACVENFRLTLEA